MKVLLIGMDGASRNTFERGWTPYISQLLAKGTDLGLKTDLFSRGWLEIATGKHASITTAMYDRPKCNGTTEWQEKFNISDIPDLGVSIKPIWQRLNEKGYSVGIMNLPTTFPASVVKGFFVSGGGGGGSVVEKPTSALCFPPSILADLVEENYIIDERIEQQVIDKKRTTSKGIFNRLAYKNEMRTNSFIRLSKKFNVDFGFIVYKTSSVLAESLVQLDWYRYIKDSDSVDTELLRAIEDYYRRFDLEIEKLHKAFPDTELFFVADHGHILRSHSVNPNRFLINNGFQVEDSINASLFSIVNLFKRLLPFWLKKALKKRNKINQLTSNTVSFNTNKTQAFCRTFRDWRYGIYINDEKRFGGKVKTKDISIIAKRIVEQFNTDLTAQKYKINAKMRDFIDSPFTTLDELYPDIILEVPDGYLITDKTHEFIKDYKAPRGHSGLESVLKGDITSMKSTTPITVCYGDKISEKALAVPYTELLDVYNIIDSMFD